MVINLQFRLFIITLLATSQIQAQRSIATPHKERMKTDIVLGDLVFTTYLKITTTGKDQVVIRSPKNADKRLFGVFKSTLGRMLGKLPRKGSFLLAKATQSKDSVIGTAKMPVLGLVTLRCRIANDSLKGVLIKKKQPIAVLKGHISAQSRNEYSSLYPKIMEITQQNIFSPHLLETPEFKAFSKKLKTLTKKAQDDMELFLGFNIYSKNLPFSHYSLVIQNKQADNDTLPGEPNLVFEEKAPGVAYVNIKNFSASQKEIAETFPRIIEKSYRNLIIDLRNNGGGGLEAALELSNYILRDSVAIGYFVTNKFTYTGFDKAAFDQLPVTKATKTEELIEELKHSKGERLNASKPQGATFKGRIYVLTNRQTASTCEPIAYVLKNKKTATLVGERTAGAMLSATYFPIEGKYTLVLPVADFYTYDGQRIEGVGVAPDVETQPGEALTKALELIKSAD